MKTKILIVDDQAEIRRLVRYALDGGGHALFEAANGATALQVAKVIQPDLILLDQSMPGGLDGLAVLQALRADPQLNHVLVVMLTGNQGEQDKRAALEAGANYFLTKPFTPARLGDLVQVMLKARPAAQ
ncbi:response regulator [Inhella gelatinilytica]|uniref:Response regulator n=1 Tax=Inhella gelatinilytica TaxID=2795030 RepID=A0A931NDN9_9BURK|nr:response regulator [Inhella gelatinilytica]MBH9551646.1 response regulator [Inhella gelatinilytica]